MALVGQAKPMDPLAADIDPYERFTPIVINNAFADNVLCIEKDRRRHRSLSLAVALPVVSANKAFNLSCNRKRLTSTCIHVCRQI